MSKIGVLVMAYGTPSSTEAIEPYYTRIRHGRPPTAEQLADLTRRYDAIGGISPLRERTDAQVEGIRATLESRAPGLFDVRFGSKYEAPMIEETAATFVADGFTKVIGIVLAPHASTMSTDQYMDRARASLGDIAFTAIGAWWDFPGFVDITAQRVNEALATIPAERHATTEVLFSAHSLPEKILLVGDTYPPCRALTWPGSRPVGPRTRGSDRTSLTSCALKPPLASPTLFRAPLALSQTTSKSCLTSTSRLRVWPTKLASTSCVRRH